MVGFYNYTVWLTYVSLISGSTGIALCFIKPDRPILAIICLMLSGFCDLFDGRIARTKKDRTNDEKSYGIQIDSLTDLVCFGALPSCILISMGMNTFSDKSNVVWFIPLAVIFILFGMIRLAYYNVLETKRQQVEESLTNSYFWGIPITTSSIILPLCYMICRMLFIKGIINQMGMFVIYAVMLGVLGLGFVAKIRIPKLQKKGAVFMVGIGVLAIIVLILLEIL